MSFSNDIENCTNQTEKMCIQVQKVFDACLKQVTQDGVTLLLTQTTPEVVTTPLTFASGRSLSSVGAISNLVVDRLADKPKCGRVQCDVTIPVEVSFVDANGVEGSGVGSLVIPMDVIMSLPDASIVPYEVNAVVSAVCPDGFYLGQSTEALQFNVVACISIILKIVMQVDVVIPTYGYATIPPSQDFTQEVCEGFFELPLFPNNG